MFGKRVEAIMYNELVSQKEKGIRGQPVGYPCGKVHWMEKPR
jgi:hypothetical protein